MSEPGGPLTAAAPDGLQVLPVRGLPDFRPGDDLAGAIAAAAPWLQDGDVLVVTSKVLSKTEGRLVPSPRDPEQRDALRRKLIDEQTVRLVAQIGRTRIVENPLGVVAAAAGIDASNVRSDEIALLPVDPDASAAELVRRFAGRGLRVGVVVTDTQGRAWRTGVTDVAIGAAGVAVLDDHRGGVDGHGNALVVTVVALGDELAAAADLVKGKLSGVPVAVVRGLAAPGTDDAGEPVLTGGGRAVLRPAQEDLFRLGTDLALRIGREQSARWSRGSDTVTGPLPAGVLPELLTALGPAAGGVRAVVLQEDELLAVVAAPGDLTAAVAAGVLLQQLRTALAAAGHGSVVVPVPPQAPAGTVAALRVGTVHRPDETTVLHDPHPVELPPLPDGPR